MLLSSAPRRKLSGKVFLDKTNLDKQPFMQKPAKLFGDCGMKHQLLAALLITAIITAAFAGSAHFGEAQIKEVGGVISSDTTWRTADGSHALNESVIVSRGATLTIEPGVEVKCEYFNITVDGTLIARGNGVNPVSFSGYGIITFTPSSTGWDDEKGSGSIIENSNIEIDGIKIDHASPKISHCVMRAMRSDVILPAPIVVTGGFPTITYNQFSGISVLDGSPLIFNNDLYAINVSAGSPTILSNTVRRGILVSGGSPEILNNNIKYLPVSIYDLNASTLMITGGSATILNNNITNPGFKIVIDLEHWQYVSGTVPSPGIEVGKDAFAFISKNNIFNCSAAIIAAKAVIQNNTIWNNTCGVQLSSPASVTLRYNNLENNSYSLFLEASGNVDAAYNWWGTTDPSATNKTIQRLNQSISGTVNLPSVASRFETFKPTQSPTTFLFRAEQTFWNFEFKFDFDKGSKSVYSCRWSDCSGWNYVDDRIGRYCEAQWVLH